MSSKSKTTSIISTLGFIIILFLICSCVFISQNALMITKCKATSSGIENDIRIAVISDLHDYSFGKDNKRLIRKVSKCEPDVIFTVGDMISDYREDYSYLSTLYEGLSEIAPVYCSLGNHELSHPESENIKEILREHATLLDNEYIELNLKGNDIRMGALMPYHPSFEDKNEYLRDFADTDKFTILLSHCPEYYFWGVDEVKIDLMVSGHTHGGQVIVPFKGGLFAPEQGYFPYYDYGVFYEENATLVITRGLGTSKQKVPRFNNPPEVLCLTLTAEVQNGK